MPDWSRSPYVYVAYGRYGHKIGISSNPHWRMAGIRATLIRKWHLPGVSHLVERTAHAILDEHKTRREWFDVSKSAAVDAVTVAIKRVRADTHVRNAKSLQDQRDAEYAAAWKRAVDAANAVAAKAERWLRKGLKAAEVARRLGVVRQTILNRPHLAKLVPRRKRRRPHEKT